MANKKNKRRAQKGAAEAVAASSEQVEEKADAKKTEAALKADKKADKKVAKKAEKKKKSKGPGVFTRIRKYFSSVRTEMKRCVWPTRQELVNFSVTVCVSLIVVGVCIALVDAAISQGLVLFAGLRG